MPPAVYPTPAFVYSIIRMLLSSVNTFVENASKAKLSTLPVTGTSVESTPSATVPNVPYELLPFVARILPPFSAK